MIFVSSSCLPGGRIGGIVRTLAQAGFQNIELSGGTSYYPEIFEDLISLKREFELTYACHAYFPPPREDFVVNLASCNDEIYRRSLQHYQDCIRCLPDIGCTTLSIHSGFFLELSPDELGGETYTKVIYDKKQGTDRFCRAYESLREMAKEYGITMFLENNVMDRTNYEKNGRQMHLMMVDSASILTLRERLDFYLLLDLGHLLVSCASTGKEFEAEARALAPYVNWVHLSNNDSTADQHRPLTIDCPVVRAFHSMIRTNCNVTLETKGTLTEIVQSYRIAENVIKGYQNPHKSGGMS